MMCDHKIGIESLIDGDLNFIRLSQKQNRLKEERKLFEKWAERPPQASIKDAVIKRKRKLTNEQLFFESTNCVTFDFCPDCGINLKGIGFKR